MPLESRLSCILEIVQNTTETNTHIRHVICCDYSIPSPECLAVCDLKLENPCPRHYIYQVPYLQMGKHNFNQIYKAAAQDLGHRPTIKISAYCDTYSPNRNYAGIIIYHTYGQFEWKQRPGQGVAGGFRGRAFYVLILCTDDWPESARRDAGQGRVHDYLYRQYFAMEYSYGKTCCGGFSVQNGQTCYSSVWLNMQAGSQKRLAWQSDGSKNLSTHEKSLVDIAVEEWKCRGSNIVVRVPDWLHSQIM
jgi:hypothetical protein